MPEKTTSDACYVCAVTAEIQNLGTSFLVNCPHCGAYEIEAIATTVDLPRWPALQTYLEGERRSGKACPLISRQLLKG